MRKVLVSLLAAGLLAALMVVPATARTRPSISITFCSFTSADPYGYAGYGLYTIPWANESPNSTTDLSMTVTFKGKGISDSTTGTFTAPVPDNVFTNGLLLPFPDAPDWNVFTSVTVKFTGAFRDSATVRQPAGGWAGPVPGATTGTCD